MSEGDERHKYLKGLLSTLRGQDGERVMMQEINTPFDVIQDILDGSTPEVKLSSSFETVSH